MQHHNKTNLHWCVASFICSNSYCHRGSSCPRCWAGYPTSRWWSRWSPKSLTVETQEEWLLNWGLREPKKPRETGFRQRLEMNLYSTVLLFPQSHKLNPTEQLSHSIFNLNPSLWYDNAWWYGWWYSTQTVHVFVNGTDLLKVCPGLRHFPSRVRLNGCWTFVRIILKQNTVTVMVE